MNKQGMVLTALLTASSAWGLSTKVDDFNQMIQENQKAEVQLRKDLQQKAGIRFDDQPGKIAKEKRAIPSESEQVIVTSGQATWKPTPSPAKKAQDRAQMKRLSQELTEAFSD